MDLTSSACMYVHTCLLGDIPIISLKSRMEYTGSEYNTNII